MRDYTNQEERLTKKGKGSPFIKGESVKVFGTEDTYIFMGKKGAYSILINPSGKIESVIGTRIYRA